jgi:hypothetical protein
MVMYAWNEDGSFSPLPASPLLLPAIGLYALLAICKLFNPDDKPAPVHLLDDFTTDVHAMRYHQLMQIESQRELEVSELIELQEIRYPFGPDHPPIHYK